MADSAMMNQILQMMGMGGGPAATAPVPAPPGDGGPIPLLPGQAPRQADPAFAAAMEEWMAVNEREPATDNDFAEIESMVSTGDTSKAATQADVLRTVTGTRGSQGVNANGDDENLPASDQMQYDRARDGEMGDTVMAVDNDLTALDPNDALMSIVGEEWSPEEYQIMQNLGPAERAKVYQDVLENDFMTDPLAPYRR